jgi:hypothetical protein
MNSSQAAVLLVYGRPICSYSSAVKRTASALVSARSDQGRSEPGLQTTGDLTYLIPRGRNSLESLG